MSAVRREPAVRPPASPADAVARRWGRRLLILTVGAWGLGLVAGFKVAVTLLTLGALAAVVSSVRNPVLGFLGVAMMCTLDIPTRFYMISGGLWRWNTLSYLMLVAVLAGGLRCRSFRTAQSGLLAALVAVLGFGLLWSLSLPTGVQHILSIVAFWGLLVFAERGGSSESWYWAGLINAVSVTLGNIAFYLSDSTIQRQMNPNAWGWFALPGIFLACIALWIGPRSRRGELILGALVAIDVGWVFLSGSRGTSLVALACLVFVLMRRGAALRGAGLAGVAMLLCVGAFFGEEQSRSAGRFGRLFDKDRSLASRTSGRSDLALAGWYLFLDNPVVGVGTGSFASRWARLDAPGLSTFAMGGEKQAHAGWIQTMAENGLPGLILLSAFVVSFAIGGWKQQARGLLPLGLWLTVTLALALVSTELRASGLWLLAASGTVHLAGPGRPRAVRRRFSEGGPPRPRASSAESVGAVGG